MRTFMNEKEEDEMTKAQYLKIRKIKDGLVNIFQEHLQREKPLESQYMEKLKKKF